ncbi:TniB family NTP-binding protein [Pseudomonas synxantha]|uniref:TniB family NTP-binding protein n=1 Tax=Pseudomonas synxantha TaxID=47883 RepID=A0ABS0UCT8_9PSED|nr:TniB family NTP-binding protein [Pseudomonas synxantha]MBI6563154.1 TniB family NTP-binding protein [Pseudomonas synxantha]MBI6583392.1 TniB family NTP-binding protein [Pseudomonas synxantha]MBI6647346.1 TniB family NTP-binding protein [Pseudomonas synxantha]
MNIPTDPEQIQDLSNHFITTPQIERSTTRVHEVINDTKISGKAKGLLICGPSGAGKSTMIKKLMSDRRKDVADGHNYKTMYMTIPAKPTTKSMGEAFLDGMNDPFARKHGHSSEYKLLRITRLLKDLGTELLIFDEMQHIVEHHRKTTEASNWIKYLMDHTGLAVVLIGMWTTQEILDNDHQLRRRFSATIDFHRFKIIKTPSDNFLILIKTLESLLKVKAISLTTDEMLQRLYYASYGLIDYLVKILNRAVWIVVKKNLEGITLEVLSQAFTDEVWGDVKDNRNPFSQQFNFRSLVDHREPFHDFDFNEQ